jgi:hypothetical protein
MHRVVRRQLGSQRGQLGSHHGAFLLDELPEFISARHSSALHQALDDGVISVRRESFAGSIPAASVAHARSGQTLKSLFRRFESARRLSLGGL